MYLTIPKTISKLHAQLFSEKMTENRIVIYFFNLIYLWAMSSSHEIIFRFTFRFSFFWNEDLKILSWNEKNYKNTSIE